jgi:hypothetical protein
MKSLAESGGLTQRAPDWWESAHFQAVSWLEAGSVKVALPRPTHQRVTPTVRRFIQKIYKQGNHENPQQSNRPAISTSSIVDIL